MTTTIKQELLQAQGVLNEFINNEENIKSIERAAEIMIECIKKGGKIIACGNGGSMSDAMHFASELTGRYRKNRPAIPALAISDPGHLSCVANDFGYENVFSRFVEAHGKEGDVALLLTTSGNSDNMRSLFRQCIVEQKMQVIAITGIIGGQLQRDMEDKSWYGPVRIAIPHSGTADRIQEVTIVVIHILVHLIEKGLGYA